MTDTPFVATTTRGLIVLCRHLAGGLLALVFLALASCALDEGAFSANGNTGIADDRHMIGRVVDRSFRAMADRYIDPPNFHMLTGQALRAVAALDGSFEIEDSARSLRVTRRGQAIIERPLPTSASDGRAWAGVFSDMVEGMVSASPALAGADRDRMTRTAMEAITRQLDRNSRYSDPEEARDNRFMRDGAGGIGITLQVEGEEAVVASVQEDGPAERAGIRAGDRLVAVNGKPVGGSQLREIVREVRGPIGEGVDLRIRRQAEQRDLDIRVVRDRVIPSTVTATRRGDLLHIQLTGFNSATTETLRKALRRARDESGGQIAGIILDLRNNPGGLLDQAVSVAEMFLENGIIATTAGRHPDSRQAFRGNGGADFAGVPMVAVINGRSASAAEILGAALQERGRAAVVGSVSYGKGSVQTVIRLPNGGELTLTWSKLYGPSGQTWNEVGVLPEVCVAKYADDARFEKQADAGAQAWRETMARWHRIASPSVAQIQEMRALCPPVNDAADKDLRLAERLLHDRPLYARLTRAGSESVAERR